MATATQANFFENNSGDFVLEARRRFPFSAKHNLLFGSGGFPMSQRCRTPWIVKLWSTAEQRNADVNKPCGSGCTLNHRIEEDL